MAHLSSCYFCGTALESPVQTYELSGGTGKNRTTVSLCSSCKEKLDIVLESTGRGTLGAADERLESTVASGNAVEESGDASDSGRGGDTEDQQDSTGDDEPGDGVPVQTEPETDTSEEAGVIDDDSAADENSLTVEEEPLDDDGVVEELDDIDDGELEELDDAFEDDEVLSDEDPSTDEPKEDPLAGETETEPTDQETGESSDREPSPDNEDEETGGQTPSETTISALEYNRVMRMLQNREFPVDREEIVVVASSAYDLAQSECNQVIDLALDRGLLDERDGELYRPED